jgi:hypothetical protein
MDPKNPSIQVLMGFWPSGISDCDPIAAIGIRFLYELDLIDIGNSKKTDNLEI